ncbi:YtpR family tRNA-binding protein [Alkalibacillus aidingensis]|uniref:YtpR family tRNA-binding protein n=1 Tax=Alkalibacillus aidingensis TaxID=2747607 RepID=UPI0016616FB1|nr:DUF4479 domain-containing protein [Alkalibacillus aidingensis]
MQVVYNPQGIGDVLILTLKQTDQNITTRTSKDVTKISISDSNEPVGYNIFNISKKMNVADYDLLNVSQEFIDKIETIFNENGLEDKLDLDLSPKFVVGYVKDKQEHEDSNKLSVCQVDVGDEELQIVCGAPNVDAGQKVVVAKVGAIMPSGLEIKDSTLRGVQSTGMICSAKELNIPDAPKEKGILVLDDQFEVGSPFKL